MTSGGAYLEAQESRKRCVQDHTVTGGDVPSVRIQLRQASIAHGALERRQVPRGAVKWQRAGIVAPSGVDICSTLSAHGIGPACLERLKDATYR